MSSSPEADHIITSILSAQNYYEVLGLHNEATDEELKSAYKRLIAKVHPDKSKHPQATEATKLLNRAYATLQEKRQEYDAYLRSPTDVDPSSFYLSDKDVMAIMVITGIAAVVVTGGLLLFDWLESRRRANQGQGRNSANSSEEE